MNESDRNRTRRLYPEITDNPDDRRDAMQAREIQLITDKIKIRKAEKMSD